MNSMTSVRPRPSSDDIISLPDPNSYGIPDVMLHGLQNVRNNTISSENPLQYSELHWAENEKMRDFQMLRMTQGLHAPLKLQMERKITSKALRLPSLTSSHVMYDTLTGCDETIACDDIFNNGQECERVADIHLMMEKHEGSL